MTGQNPPADAADAPRLRCRTCAGCAHWFALPERISARVGVVGGIGECRALPPAQDLRFSRTRGEDWCGLQKPKDGPDRASGAVRRAA